MANSVRESGGAGSPTSARQTLVVTTRYPFYGQFGGRRRLESIVQSAALDGPVDLVCFAPGRRARNAKAEQRLFRNVHFVPFRRLSSLAGLVRSVFAGGATQEGLYASPAMAAWLRKHSAAYDVTIFHLIRAGQYLADSRSRRRVLELTDAISLAHARVAAKSSLFRAWFNRYEARRCLAAEYRQVRVADVAVFVSELDRIYLVELFPSLRERLAVVPVSVPDSLFQVQYHPQRPSACFVGAMWFGPNIEGCEWLIANVVQPLRARLPNFRLEIIGDGPPHVLKRFAAMPGVVVHGFVNDLADVVGGCVATLTPDLSGVGMQTKLVDSLAMGLPTLCSPLAGKPVECVITGVLRVCAEPDDFVAEFVALAQSEALRHEVSQRGREAARLAFHEAVVRDAYHALL